MIHNKYREFSLNLFENSIKNSVDIIIIDMGTGITI